MNIAKPTGPESNPFYDKYVELVNEPDLIPALQVNGKAMIELFAGIPSEIEVFRYDTNKWSIKEVLLHIIDFERYLAFKTFVTLRNDVDTVIYHPQRDKYLSNAYPETRSLSDLVPEFVSVRSASISMFEHANFSQLTHITNHENINHAVSARTLGFSIAGHCIHHMKIISEKYLRLSAFGKRY